MSNCLSIAEEFLLYNQNLDLILELFSIHRILAKENYQICNHQKPTTSIHVEKDFLEQPTQASQKNYLSFCSQNLSTPPFPSAYAVKGNSPLSVSLQTPL